MEILVVETLAGRGGPHAMPVMKCEFPTGNFLILDPPSTAISTMPDCPGCGGLGITHLGQEDKWSVMDIVEGRADMTCRLCGGNRQIPRGIFERVILDLAALSLELPVE